MPEFCYYIKIMTLNISPNLHTNAVVAVNRNASLFTILSFYNIILQYLNVCFFSVSKLLPNAVSYDGEISHADT